MPVKDIVSLLLLGSLCWAPATSFGARRAFTGPGAQRQPAISYSRWNFQEDFSRGIPGWMSFPLAQDVGYDPSIYTEPMNARRVLVRDVVAEGQRTIRVGMLKPMHFRITPESMIRLKYEIEMSGNVGPANFIVGTKSGRKFSVSIPSGNGEHKIEIQGSSLRVPAAGANTQIVVIEADTTNPILGAHNRLVLEAINIDAENEAAVPVILPRLLHSAAMTTPVAATVVEATHPVLPIHVSAEKVDTEITLYDGSGKKITTAVLGKDPVSLGPSPTPGLWRAHLNNRGAQSDFRFLVLGHVPPHPRLLLTPERLEQLRTQMPSDALRKIIRERATSAAAAIAYNPKAGESIRLMSPDSVLPGLHNYFLLLENYGNAIVLNALDYRLTGSKKSLDAARRALLAASHWSTWTPPWFAAHGLHTYYEVGIFMQQNAVGYDLIADQLSAGEKIQIADGFYRNAVVPAVEEYFLNDRMSIAASNHMAHAVGGAIAACIAVYGDVPNWNTRFAPALAELLVSNENLLRGLFPGDGSEAEPAGYEDFAMEGMSVGMASLQRIGIQPAGTDRMIESFWWPYYVQYKPGYLLDTGDWDGVLTSLSGYAWTAEYSGNPTLRAFYDSAITHSLKSIFLSEQNHRTPPYAPDMLDLICCTKPAGIVPAAPPSRLFPLRGSAALRSGWGPDDTLVSIRVGAWFNHEHHDEGSFQVASYGEELIGEAGYTDYYTDPRYRNYFTQIPGHNTIMLDNNAFSQNSYQGRYWKTFDHYPTVTRHILGDGIDYLSADLTSAYNGSLKSFTREFLFLKPGVLLVHDRVDGTAPHHYSFLLHVPPDAVPSVDGTIATVRGKKANAFAIAAGTPAHWTLESAPIPIIAYRNFDKIPVEPRNTFRLESAQADNAVFTVGLQFLPSSSATESLKAISTANAEGFATGVGKGAVTALFRTRPGDLSRNGFTTDGDVLAAVGAQNPQHLFAGNARIFRANGRTVLSSNVSVDAEITLRAKEDAVQLFASGPATLSMGVRSQVRAVSVDGKEINVRQNGNLIKLKLNDGEHSVRIAY
ncbi:MAG: heparinase II/III domain-containing protein [Acidobacteriaceae bacterium]